MNLEIPESIKILSNEPLDAKYLNGTVAYASLAEANALIPIGIRSPYLTIVVQGAEYWWADGAWGLKTPHITKTLTEINALIASNGLVKGSLYKITGCQTSLYGGTDLYLRALETNKLDTKGVGKFFNPKYENISGNGIWTGYVECGVSTIVGLFDNNELITANNGATGQLFGNVNGGFITPLTGTWSTATSITGNASGATALINNVSVPLTYAIGAKTIWGGYHWTNLTGNLGSKVDDLNLDATNWVKVAYNTTDYNISYDEITYDYGNDFISGRKDALGNDMSFTTEDFINTGVHGIRYFMWGNTIVKSNLLNGAYVNVLNFRGSTINSTTFGQDSSINSTTFGQGSTIYSTTFEQGSNINSTTFGQDSSINSNTFGKNLSISSCTFGQGSSINSTTFGQGSSINSTTFIQGSGIIFTTFGQDSSIQYTTIPANKSIQFATFEQGSSIDNTSLTTAIEIFTTNQKTVFKTNKIRYYNNNNVLVIADITD